MGGVFSSIKNVIPLRYCSMALFIINIIPINSNHNIVAYWGMDKRKKKRTSLSISNYYDHPYIGLCSIVFSHYSNYRPMGVYIIAIRPTSRSEQVGVYQLCKVQRRSERLEGRRLKLRFFVGRGSVNQKSYSRNHKNQMGVILSD